MDVNLRHYCNVSLHTNTAARHSCSASNYLLRLLTGVIIRLSVSVVRIGSIVNNISIAYLVSIIIMCFVYRDIACPNKLGKASNQGEYRVVSPGREIG